MYGAGEDPYVYPGSFVLKNLFGIHSAAKHAKLERRLTSARADEGLPTGRRCPCNLSVIGVQTYSC